MLVKKLMKKKKRVLYLSKTKQWFWKYTIVLNVLKETY